MNRERISAIALLIALATVSVLYLSQGPPQTVTPSPLLGEQREIADLKKQLAGLQQRVDWLEERFIEPQRQKPSQF
jgi:hypothetical protein